MKKINSSILLSLFLIIFGGNSQAASNLQITPERFDFGWAPDNAIIACDFKVKNVGGEMIPLTGVQPSCGCTATNFTPDALPSSEEMKINMTFNTRGYAGIKFNKSIQVKAGMPEELYTVYLEGFVADPNAKIVPDEDGVVSFSTGSTNK